MVAFRFMLPDTHVGRFYFRPIPRQQKLYSYGGGLLMATGQFFIYKCNYIWRKS